MLQAPLQLYKKAYSGVSRSMWWLSLVLLVNRAGTMVVPFLTVYLTAKGYSIGDAGFVMAMFGFGGILGGFLGGQLSDKIGFFYVQFFSLILSGTLFFVLGAMQGIVQIGACVFLLSIVGESFRPANSAAIAAYSTADNRTRSYSLNRLAINLGWSVGPALGGFLASISYSLLFIVDGTTCLAAALLLFIFLSPQKSNPFVKPDRSEAVQSAYKDKPFLLSMLFLFLTTVCFFQLFNVVAVFFKNEVHLSESIIGLVLAMNGIIIVFVEMVMIYKLENKRPSLSYMTIGAGLVGLAFLILLLPKHLVVVILSMVVITFGEMLLFPFVNSFWVSRSHPSNRGQYAAINTMTFAATMVAAPTLGAQVADRFGFSALWLVNVILCAASMCGFIWLNKNNKHE